MGERPAGTTLERRNNNKDYTPDNCYWADLFEQNNNRSNNRQVTVDGVTKTVSEWAHVNNLSVPTVFTRLRRGWSEADAVTKPARVYITKE